MRVLRKNIQTYTNLLQIILTATCVFAPNDSSAAALKCGIVFEAGTKGTWRKNTDGDLYSAFRSNPVHYWNWLAKNSRTSNLFKARGVVTGDPHILNFAPVELKQGGRKTALVDMDDSGINAPLIGDFLRHLVGNQISPYRVESKKLLNAYIDGLAGKKTDKPDFLKKLEDMSESDYKDLQKDHIKKLSDGEFFSEKAGLSPISSAPPAIQTLYKNSESALRAQLTNYKILDLGYKIKSSGGSQGLARFWFLAENHGEKHVFEFKQESEPATAQIAAQPEPLTRFQKVSEIYRPSEEALGPYAFIKAGTQTFLFRERLPNLMDFDPAELSKAKHPTKEIQQGVEFSIYLFNKMGRWHGQQAAGQELLTAIQSNPTQAESSLAQLSKMYYDEMIRLQK